MTPGDYVSIACSVHEGLELAVLRRQHLRLAWVGEQGPCLERVLPLDVATHDAAEWLRISRPEGQEVRLDRLLLIQPA